MFVLLHNLIGHIGVFQNLKPIPDGSCCSDLSPAARTSFLQDFPAQAIILPRSLWEMEPQREAWHLSGMITQDHGFSSSGLRNDFTMARASLSHTHTQKKSLKDLFGKNFWWQISHLLESTFDDVELKKLDRKAPFSEA